ncbi:MAG: hypothetical protein HS116_19360 [Planctomycetes bacterium]|nr:hypothetical protein [Planctomycetota bacterium]
MNFFKIWRHQVDTQLDEMAETFVEDFKPERKTVVLIPGFPGSNLIRSLVTYPQLDGKAYARSNYNSTNSWHPMLPSSLKWELAINPDGSDVDQHVILQNGPISVEIDFIFKFRVAPYEDAIEYFQSMQVNVLQFGNDFRRGFELAACNLIYLLSRINESARKARKPIHFENWSIAGHSFGGLIALAFANLCAGAESSVLSRLKANCFKSIGWPGNIFTVGAPLYGSTNSALVVYKGRGPLNDSLNPEKVPRIASTWLGLYDLFITPPEMFKDVQKRRKDLSLYPVRDYKTGKVLDPYQEVGRYPIWVSERSELLAESKARKLRLLRHIPRELKPRFFNLCGSELHTNQGYEWKALKGKDNKDIPFNIVEHSNPIRPFADDKGDGVVPTWSACHADFETTDPNVIHLSDPVEHDNLMNSREVLQEVMKRMK